MTQLFGLLAHELWSLPPPPFIPHLSHTYPTLTPRFLSLSTDKGSGSQREAGEGPGPRAWPPRGRGGAPGRAQPPGGLRASSSPPLPWSRGFFTPSSSQSAEQGTASFLRALGSLQVGMGPGIQGKCLPNVLFVLTIWE